MSADYMTLPGFTAARTSGINVGCSVFAALLLFFNTADLIAQSPPHVLRHGFEESPVIAQAATKNLLPALTEHSIRNDNAHTGTGCEQWVFQSSAQQVDDSQVVITVPRARVFNELSAGLWVRTNCANVRLGMRIRYPHQIDPRTNAPLEVELFGDLYSDYKNWQQLVCRTSEEALQSRLIRVRSQLSDGINIVRLDEREAYVDQLILQFQLPAGPSALMYDDLEFGPVVRPEKVVPDSSSQGQVHSRLSIENDRIRKNEEPFFPIITLYHAEALDLIARSGVNMVWIRNYDDRPLLTALEGMDIGAIASPPQPPPAEAILNQSALPSIPDWTSPIWAWMLGINLPASDRPFVTAWAEQVRNADRQIHRPIFADVAAEERDFHRQIDLLSVTRCQINTSHSSLEHFEDLRGRRAHALPGKQLMTFVQTEASGPLLDYFGERTNLPIVEPEQILHQGFEAVAAGFKGIGFWKQIPFDTDAPGLKERLDAIRIFSIQARLLEPFIATGRIVDEVPVQVDVQRNPRAKTGASPLSTRWDRPVTADGKPGPAPGENPEIRATVFHTDRGLLILLVWHEPGAQCVPGPQTASNVRVLIRGIGDVATACEVTATSVDQSNLSMARVSGGTELTLKQFDQYAAIVVTGTTEEAAALQKMAWKTRQAAAESYVNLAESKLSRVREIQQQLEAVGAPPVVNSRHYLAYAEQYLQEARVNLGAERADDARQASQKSMQQLRVLQRQHWELAVAPLTAPTSTLEATGFQTLPDHWKLITELGQGVDIGENRLPSGDFENEQALAQPNDSQHRGWTSGAAETRYSSLRLVRSEADTNTYLSMVVKPDAPPEAEAVLISPAVEASAGELVVITGQFRLPHPLHGPDHRFEIFDTLAGREGSISVKEPVQEWKQFRLIRRASRSGPVRVRFELQGPGIAEVDRVQVHVLPAGQILRTSR